MRTVALEEHFTVPSLDRRIRADVQQHALVGELDERVAEVEEEPDGHAVARLRDCAVTQ